LHWYRTGLSFLRGAPKPRDIGYDPPSWIKAGKYGDSEVVDLARTIAFILNVRPPNGCEGRVLSEAMN
jgi:hypothetical protein